MQDELARIRELLSDAIRIIDEQVYASSVKPSDIFEELCDPKGGFWSLILANSKLVPIRFFRNGHLNSPSGCELWRLDGRQLTLKWPNDKAPGGFWVDKMTASPDGRFFEGKNQNGMSVKLFFRSSRQVEEESSPIDQMEIDELKSLLDSETWPQATFAFQVTDENSESDKQDRAEGIANVLLPPMKGKRFLDFGCGEGHLVRFVSDETLVSVGYDISAAGDLSWESEGEGFLLTTDLKKVESKGPYDVILLYDVVDHVDGDISSVIKAAGSFLADEGVMILRCHPWSSRHGGHLYRKMNKAFVHLVLTPEEMGLLGLDPPPSQKIIMPLEVYDEAIRSSGLKKQKGPESDVQDVEPFFWTNHLVRTRIFRSFGLNLSSSEMPKSQLSICFVDYWLGK